MECKKNYYIPRNPLYQIRGCHISEYYSLRQIQISVTLKTLWIFIPVTLLWNNVLLETLHRNGRNACFRKFDTLNGVISKNQSSSPKYSQPLNPEYLVTSDFSLVIIHVFSIK